MGVSSSKKSQSSLQRDDEFTELVLSLSVDEICDENLYKHKVEKIPQQFESVDKYFSSFVYPLLEETRAELASALDAVYKAPYAEVYKLIDSRSDSLLYTVSIGNWRKGTSDSGNDLYKTLPGDVLLLTNLKPETGSDMQRFGSKYTFVTLQRIVEDLGADRCTVSLASKEIDVEDYSSRCLYVVYLTNIITNKRIWNALHMRENLSVIKNILSKNQLDQGACEYCPRKSSIKTEFGDTLLSSLNESQNQAVSASLQRLECRHKSSVELIWGPPGTGKTKTLSVLLYILLKMNIRTLVCAPTNVAITGLATRVVKLVRDSFRAECNYSVLSCPLDGILIFGNRDKLKIGLEIEDIFFDSVLDGLGQYKYRVASMIDLLENLAVQYRSDEVVKSKPKSFLEFARERFKNTTLPFRRSLLAFLTRVPRRSLVDQVFHSMNQILSLLDSFETDLFDENISSEKLEEAFYHEQIECGSESFNDSSMLTSIRSRCLSMLKYLQSSPANDIPVFDNKDAVMKLCFEQSSLIFCTTSTSFKLHSEEMKMNPFELLVIDEAAQAKECECLIPLQVANVRHAILVGDERQLPATVSSKMAEESGFGKSLFERLSSLGHFKHLLNMQYRMHPSICLFPNSTFYGNQIHDAPNVQHTSYEKCYLQGNMFGPYSFIDVPGVEEKLDDDGHSRRNMVEVAVILKLLQRLYKGWQGSNEKLSIGVISPYAAQVVAIKNKLKMFTTPENFTIKVKSVDGFQGGEQDVIIISTVRANKGGTIGFLASRQRTNVALTRARHCLWIIGNAMTLSKSDSVWQALVYNAKYRRCFYTVDEDSEIAKAILNIKKELDQLEDMLNTDSVLFKNTRWTVHFSDNFKKSFESLRHSHLKKLVMNLLLKLASGWRPRKINVDSKCKSSKHIVKQFKVENHFVVCSIDVIREDPVTNIYSQVLKVWDVLPRVEIPKLLDRLDKIFKMLTYEFIELCNEKHFEGKAEVPGSWLLSNELIRFKNWNADESSCVAGSSSDCRGYVENSRVSESLLLMKFYSLSTSVVKHLLTDHEGGELDLPFVVTDEERRIILFPRTSFIIGRSGTGKTTVLTMKLYRSLQQFCFASGETVASEKSTGSSEYKVTKLHQLFVTVSPKLCYAIKRHMAQLKRFASGDVSTDASVSEMDDLEEVVEFRDIPDSFIGIQPEKYPLIITFHKFIMMLDGTLGNSYFQRFRDVRDSLKSEATTSRSVALQTFLRKNEVTYDRFSSLYWPHFNSKMTKNLEPSVVFTEIMSRMKGGLSEGENLYSKLSRHQYVLLSESRVSTISAQQREVIYDIYLQYEKMKLVRSEFDLADLVNDIHFRLNNENLLGDKMDFVYIDEVQDLTMRQIALFRYLCTNVDEGFVFSGDTAQTIARGIDFRFEDIKSLFQSRNCVGGSLEKKPLSDTFYLSHNFRTHTGVLKLAQSVVDLIYHYFPRSIDKLTPETSFVYGKPPVLLEPGSDENAIVTIFGTSSRACQRWIGFGADQVILVRDDFARKEITKYVGRQAIVLTIVECKGLEFQDVLLYNFFGSSPLGSKWRVLYEYLNARDLLDNSSLESFQSFDDSRHSLMCSELKQLYVAITRTRQGLWICEKKEDVSKPMFDYWRMLDLVQVREVDDSIAEAMQSASSPEEWRAQGKKLFWESNYEMAEMCFEKAGDEFWEKQARASGLRATADRLRDTNLVESRAMLTSAAEILESIGKADTAAEYFCELGHFERAGRVYLEKCGMYEVSKAGECFMLAGRYEMAAKAYHKGNYFTQCLSACTKGKHFDMGLQFIENWREQTARDGKLVTELNKIDIIAQDFLESCALQCHRTKDNVSMLNFVRAFHTLESKRNFLRSLDCLKELISLEEENGNFDEAAKIAKSIGDVLLEADLLGKGEKYLEASSLILSYVLCNSLWLSGNKGWPLKSFPRKDELLGKAKLLARNVSESFCASICNEVEILSHGKRSLCELIHIYVASKQCKSHITEILSVKELLEAHMLVHPSEFEWEHELPSDGERYFEEKIMTNQVSLRTLVCAWSMRRKHILLILECLDFPERHEHDKYEGIMEFSMSYFGIRLSDNMNYQLMNSTTEWVKNIEKRFIRRSREVAFLDAPHFVLAARKYWQEELHSDGFRVLATLQALYCCSEKKGLSKFCQCVCLTDIYDTAKFLMYSESIVLSRFDTQKLEEFMNLSMKYFSFVFPLDPRESLSRNLISFRQSQTSKNLLEEFMLRDLDTRSEPTHGQIGRAVMIWLGSGKPSRDCYQKIIEGTGDNSSWKSFIELLWIMDSPKEPGNIDSVSENLALSHAFHVAVESTYFANWRTSDYISPSCFLYLVERLLILVPHSRGVFYATKSSLVERLIADTNPSGRLIPDKTDLAQSIFDFIARVIQQFLHNIPDNVRWIGNSGIKGDYLPIFMLRLIMIQCLLCLNSEMPLTVLLKLLVQVRSYLPPTFCEAIRLSWKEDHVILNAVAKAFAVVEDPIVIIAFEENEFMLNCCPEGIFLNAKLFSSKQDVMDLLFPMNVLRNNVTMASTELAHDVNEGMEMIVEDDSVLSPDNGTANLLKKWDFQGLSDMLGSPEETSENIQSLKAIVDERWRFLVSAILELTNTKQRSDPNEDASNLSVAFEVTEYMEQLSSLSDKSEPDNDDVSRMRELLTKLQSGVPQLVKFYDTFATEDASTSTHVSKETISSNPNVPVKSRTKNMDALTSSSQGPGETSFKNPSVVVNKSSDPDNKHGGGGGGEGKSNRKKNKNKKGGKKGKKKNK